MINLDEIYTRTPVTVFDGNEIILVQKENVTGGSLLSLIKNFFKTGLLSSDISDSTVLGRDLIKVSNLASAKTLLDIPEQPLTPVTVSDNTTLTKSNHANRRVIASAEVVLTLSASSFQMTDYLNIINPNSTTVTINAGASEDIRLKDGTGTVTTFNILGNGSARLFLIDSNTWFAEI